MQLSRSIEKGRFLWRDPLDDLGGDRDGPRDTDFQGGSPNYCLPVAISATVR
jgi:hypothetical protein